MTYLKLNPKVLKDLVDGVLPLESNPVVLKKDGRRFLRFDRIRISSRGIEYFWRGTSLCEDVRRIGMSDTVDLFISGKLPLNLGDA